MSKSKLREPEHVAGTRDDLPGTGEKLAGTAAGALPETVRRRPGRWASTGAAVVAAGATAAGVLRWRRTRRTPQSRAKRAWQSVAGRFSR